MSLLTTCREAIDAASIDVASNPALRGAVSSIEAGQVRRALGQLAQLEARQLYLATMLCERLAVREGIGGAKLALLGEHLNARLQDDDIDLWSCIDGAWEQGWREAVAGKVESTRLESTSWQAGWGSQSLLEIVRQLLAHGQVDAALEHAEQIAVCDKEVRAEALARVGVASSAGVQTALLVRAVETANASPMIQDGGEEALALARVVVVLTEAGIDADHQAARLAVDCLLELGKTRKRKDVRSYGLKSAAQAAALTARPGWMAHADALLESIWTHELTWPGLLILAREHRRAGHREREEACLTRLLAKGFSPAPELMGLYPDRCERLLEVWSSSEPKLAELALLVELGVDVSVQLDQVEHEAARWHHGLEQLYGKLSVLAPERAQALLDRIEQPGEAFAAAARTLYANPERRGEALPMLRRALAAGWLPYLVGRWLDLFVAEPELLAEIEQRCSRQRDIELRMRCLSGVAQGWLSLGRWPDAIRAIESSMIHSNRDPTPDWTPFYRRGSGSDWIPRQPPQLELAPPLERPFAEALDELLAPTFHTEPLLQRLHAFAKHLRDPDELTRVRKHMKGSSRGSGDEAVIKRARLADIDLRRGDPDSALAEAHGMGECRASGWGPSLTAQLIAGWLDMHPEQLDLDRALRLIEVLGRPAAQDIPLALLTVLPTLMAHLDGPAREQAIGRCKGLRGRFRSPGDHAMFEAALAMGYARLAQVEHCVTHLRAAMGLVREASVYLGASAMVFAVTRCQADCPLPDHEELLTRALDLAKGNDAAERTEELERCARYLWLAGEQELLPRLVVEERYPAAVRAALRRSLIVDAPRYAPRPVEAILAAWSSRPPNLDQAHEQVRCLAEALAKEGRDQDAQELRTLLA